MSGGVLILRDVVFADTAVYQCEATNKHGSALLNTFLHVVGECAPQPPPARALAHVCPSPLTPAACVCQSCPLRF